MLKDRIKIWYNRIFKNVHNKYRLVIMDENFHEKLSFRLSRMNIFVFTGVLVFTLIAGTFALIAFTGLRNFIPGHTSDEALRLSYENERKLDSLQTLISQQTTLFAYMKQAMDGDIPYEEVDNVKDSLKNYADLPYRRGKADSMMRLEVETRQKELQAENLKSKPAPKNVAIAKLDPNHKIGRMRTDFSETYTFFTPFNGLIVTAFDPAIKQNGIEIIGYEGDVVKATLSGRVLATNWSNEEGYTISIQHNNNMVSVYKNNYGLLKQPGDFVGVGEPIGLLGNQPNTNSKLIPHQLGFELWFNGTAVNPCEFIIF